MHYVKDVTKNWTCETFDNFGTCDVLLASIKQNIKKIEK